MAVTELGNRCSPLRVPVREGQGLRAETLGAKLANKVLTQRAFSSDRFRAYTCPYKHVRSALSSKADIRCKSRVGIWPRGPQSSDDKHPANLLGLCVSLRTPRFF